MLTIRQNFLETIRGGNPDRFVNQYEFLSMVRGDPITGQSPRCTPAAARWWTPGASPRTGPPVCPAS